MFKLNKINSDSIEIDESITHRYELCECTQGLKELFAVTDF